MLKWLKEKLGINHTVKLLAENQSLLQTLVGHKELEGFQTFKWQREPEMAPAAREVEVFRYYKDLLEQRRGPIFIYIGVGSSSQLAGYAVTQITRASQVDGIVYLHVKGKNGVEMLLNHSQIVSVEFARENAGNELESDPS